MAVAEILLLAVGLSMDAFAVSVCKGLSLRRAPWDKALITGLYFGVFQALMPLLGYFLGIRFLPHIEKYDHWIAFGMLGVIGGKMIFESFEKAEACSVDAKSFSPGQMLPLAVATSIDALAVGISFALLKVSIASAVSMIGITTFVICAVGVKIGNVLGLKFKARAEFAGGVVLILIGLKIVLEHTGIL